MSIDNKAASEWIKTGEKSASLWLNAVIDYENGVTYPDPDDPEGELYMPQEIRYYEALFRAHLASLPASPGQFDGLSVKITEL